MTDINETNVVPFQEDEVTVTAPTTNDILAAKLDDALVPGFEVEFSPDEAELLGAFSEDALSETDAKESVIDNGTAQ